MNSKPKPTMKICYWCVMVCLISIVIIDFKWASAAPSPQTEDVLKALQQLDRLYSAVARPRFGKRAREDINYLGTDYDHNQEYQRADMVSRNSGVSSGAKYILDLDPMYR